MVDRYRIEIRLVGDNMTPDKVSSRDIGELLPAIEQMIASLIARDNPALGLDESEVVVGLAAIEQGSYKLQFETLYEVEVARAYRQITGAISADNYGSLPLKSIEAIKIVRKFTRKYKTDTQFWEKNGRYAQLATVTVTTKIDVETTTITGKTTLYGTVIRVGGENPPRAKLRLLDGTLITCNITETNILKVARELGRRLYSMVGVHGTARWDTRDMSIEYFLIDELTPYTPTRVGQALEALYNVAGEYYDSVPDIESMIADARGTDEDS